jgi:hypothetical protein
MMFVSVFALMGHEKIFTFCAPFAQDQEVLRQAKQNMQ